MAYWEAGAVYRLLTKGKLENNGGGLTSIRDTMVSILATRDVSSVPYWIRARSIAGSLESEALPTAGPLLTTLLAPHTNIQTCKPFNSKKALNHPYIYLILIEMFVTIANNVICQLLFSLSCLLNKLIPGKSNSTINLISAKEKTC